MIAAPPPPFVWPPLPILVAILSAIFAFISGVLGPAVQLFIGKRQAAAAQRAADAAMVNAKNAGVHAIAVFRREWIESVRLVLSEYHSILMSAEKYPYSLQEQLKLSDLGTRLDLLLNPDEPESRKLLDVADKILLCEDVEGRQAMDSELIAAARAVLKKEWNRVKDELGGVS